MDDLQVDFGSIRRIEITHMTFIDRIFVAVPLFLVVVVGMYVQLHVKSVADFMMGVWVQKEQ